jgi:arylformamidase
MKLHDVTLRLSARLPTYPGDPAFELEAVQRISDGDDANVSRMRVGTHAGTHVDAIHHFRDGGTTVDELPLELLVGPARVVEVSADRGIGPEHLGEVRPGDERVLLKTRNSSLWELGRFTPDYVFLSEPGAEHLIRSGVRLVGIDYLSIEEFDRPGARVHHLLLGQGVVIVEGLDLSRVSGGVYELICLPLPVEGADGAPARVVLREG